MSDHWDLQYNSFQKLIPFDLHLKMCLSSWDMKSHIYIKQILNILAPMPQLFLHLVGSGRAITLCCPKLTMIFSLSYKYFLHTKQSPAYTGK